MWMRSAGLDFAKDHYPKSTPVERRLTEPRTLCAAGLAVGLCILLSACSLGGGPTRDAQLGVAASPRIAAGRSVPKGGGIYKVGRPYKVGGRWYVPREVRHYDRTGVASWYGAAFHGRRTANGEIYDMNALTAGHPILPLPSYAYITNLSNGRTILVRINDRGPYVNNRLIDLSRRSAGELGFTRHGLARVRVRYVGRAPLNGSDRAERRFLAAQSWHRGSIAVARASNSDISTGALRAAAAPPDWSVLAYRQQLLAAKRRTLDTPRATLGGPRHAYVEAGTFATRAEAERMRHELEHVGPIVVERVDSGSGPPFRVRIGPLDSHAAAEAAQTLAGLSAAGDLAAVEGSR